MNSEFRIQNSPDALCTGPYGLRSTHDQLHSIQSLSAPLPPTSLPSGDNEGPVKALEAAGEIKTWKGIKESKIERFKD